MKESINVALKRHASTIEDWGHMGLSQLFHVWADRLNEEFYLAIDTPAIRFDRVSGRVLGIYRVMNHERGADYEMMSALMLTRSNKIQ